ncbi:MAG: hypothetical protein OWQ57_08465 [Sulfobacillus sp.]|nr:hypothetical protein [Sulfobacillus sp.]
MDRLEESLGLCWDLTQTIERHAAGHSVIQEAVWLLQVTLRDVMEQTGVPQAIEAPRDPAWVHPLP